MAPTASLVLPAPRNESEGEEYQIAAASKAARVEEVDEVTEQSTSSINRYTSGGIIYPPPELRALVDKTATFVARNGAQFESKIKEDGMGRNKLSFLNETDPYHAYYRAKIEAVTSGQGPLAGTEPSSQDSPLGGVNGDLLGEDNGTVEALKKKKEEEAKPAEPESFQFSADMPNITAVDLDILKLTALYTAQKGRSFASSLAAREGRSYQFEFLRPSHSLFGYFNRIVEQYRLVLDPTEEAKANVRNAAFGSKEEYAAGVEPVTGIGRGGARLVLLDQIRARAEWQKWEKARRRKEEEDEEKERDAFNQIDWQDFVVAGTVELTETDAHIDLPPPMSLREVENMSMAQKRMAEMISEVEGDGEEVEVQGVLKRTHANTKLNEDDDVEMEMEEDSDSEEAAAPSSVTPAATNGPMKIRKDYQPKTLAERKAAAASQSTICPVCKASVPLNQMEEHVKYELLDPHYREQRNELEAKKAHHNALSQGADPSRFLKQFAGRRTDIFGSAAEEEAQKRKEEEETRKRKEREKLVWDGHAASRVDTTNEFNRPEQLQDEMQHIQKKFKTDQEKIYIGPQIGSALADVNAGAAPMQTPSHSNDPMSAGAITYSAVPSAPPPPPSMMTLPPQQQVEGFAGYPGYQHPSQYTLEKRTDGTLYPEGQWMQNHPEPITIIITLPEALSVSEKLNGSQVSFETLAPSTTIGIIRDRIQTETLEGGVGVSRLKLRVDGKPTTLRQTLAHWNLISGDVITLQVS